MDFDLWYLVLIPLLFLAGWLARGLDDRDRKNAKSGYEDEYERALTLLIAQDSRQAADQLVAIARQNPDALKLHFTLGVLFRQQGHFDQAIRLHRYLVERPDVCDELRGEALKALGEDYLRAGLFDRAEDTLLRLAKIPTYHLYALRELEGIYVTEHAWIHAIDTATQRMRVQKLDRSREVGHYWCELGDLALRAKKPEEAAHQYEEALKVCPTHARASLALGRLIAKTSPDDALALWAVAASHPDEYLPLILGEKVNLLVSLGRTDDALRLLEATVKDHFTVDVLQIAVKAWERLLGAEGAKAQLEALLEDKPKLSVLAQWWRLEKTTVPSEGPLAQLLPLLKPELTKTQQYECQHCGFLSSAWTWHCLRCGSWESFEVKRPPKPRSY